MYEKYGSQSTGTLDLNHCFSSKVADDNTKEGRL